MSSQVRHASNGTAVHCCLLGDQIDTQAEKACQADFACSLYTTECYVSRLMCPPKQSCKVNLPKRAALKLRDLMQLRNLASASSEGC